MNNFEVFTTTDKARRDQMFEDLRKSDDPLERQVVKFSSVEPSANDSVMQFNDHGKLTYHGPKWVSNWSVAYPRT